MYNVIISPLVYNVIIRGGSYGDHAIFSAFNVYIYMYVYICIDIYICIHIAGESAAGREGTRRSEKAKVSEEALLTRSSKAEKPTSACVHTYTKSQTPSTRRRPRLANTWKCRGYEIEYQ